MRLNYLSAEEGVAINVSYGENLLHSETVKGNYFYLKLNLLIKKNTKNTYRPRSTTNMLRYILQISSNVCKIFRTFANR